MERSAGVRPEPGQRGIAPRSRGLGDPGRSPGAGADGDFAATSTAGSEPTALERALLWAGVERQDLERMAGAASEVWDDLRWLLVPGGPLLRELIRFLIRQGDYDHAERLAQANPTLWKDLLDELWPTGAGVTLDATLSATLAVPVQLTGKLQLTIQRTAPDTFELVQRTVGSGGLDLGVGVGVYLRFGAYGLGASAGAEAGADLVVTVVEKFRFRIFDDWSLLPVLVLLADAETWVDVAALFEESLRWLDPDRYRTYLKVEGRNELGGAALAEIGFRSPGDRSGAGGSRVTGTRFTSHSGRLEDSRREDILRSRFRQPEEKSLVRVSWVGIAQTMLRASVGGQVHLGVAGGLELKPKYNGEPDGTREPTAADLSLYAEGDGAVSLATAVPVLGTLLPSLGVAVGGGLRVRFRATYPFTLDTVELAGHELYLKSGDLDVYEGSASEVALELPGLDPTNYQSLEAFLAAIQSSRAAYRVAVGAPIGRRYALALVRQESFRTMLSPEYQHYGLLIAGFLTIRFKMPQAVLRRMLGRIGDAIASAVQGLPEVQYVREVLGELQWGAVPAYLPETVKDAVISVLSRAGAHLLHFLEEGELPPEAEALLYDLAEDLAGALKSVEVRVALGVGGAAGAHAGKGAAKVRLHLAGRGQVFHEEDVTDLVKGEEAAVRAGEVIDLLRGTWDEAEPLLKLSPGEIEAARASEARESD